MALRPGDPVCLVDARGRVVGLRAPAAGDVVRVPGLGVVPGTPLLEAGFGGELLLGSHELFVMRPTPALMARAVEHVTQVIHAKDAGRIIAEVGVRPGDTVVEGGTGSGALTSSLALLVGDTGHVHGHEPNGKHRDVTAASLETFGLAGRVTLWSEPLESTTVTGADAFIVDLPDPRSVVAAAARALAPGGRLAVYAPQVTQIQAVVQEARSAGFGDVHVLEVLERPWVVDAERVRPSHDMLGHTAFLMFGVRCP